MNFKFDKNNIAVEKGKPKLEHEFIVPADWNGNDVPESKRISVICEYLKTGELSDYTQLSQQKTLKLSQRELFRDKVKEIRNFIVEGQEIKTAEEFLELPSSTKTTVILAAVTQHIAYSDSLTLDEQKNS